MGSLGTQMEQKEMVIPVLSFGGFDKGIKSKELADYLEERVALIWRCKLKTSWTPPDSYPDFGVTTAPRSGKNDYKEVPPHAFVHFAYPEAAKKAIDVAGRSELIFRGKPLRINSGMESAFRIRRRRTTDPHKLLNVFVEIGTLVSRNEFWTSWTGPKTGAEFVIDPFDGHGKILFSKEIAFSVKETNQVVIINCELKVDFLLRDIDDIKLHDNRDGHVLIFRLTSAPWVYYRTAGDDIYESVPCNLLDDDDPWIRTTDFTDAGAIGRCCSYRISVPPRLGGKLERAMAYMRERRIPQNKIDHPILVKKDPDYGARMPDPFFSVQHKEGISFATLFLVNAVVHKGIINQQHLTEEFFDLLRSQSNVVNDTALRHIWSYRRPIFDASKRLKLVQNWLLNNSDFLKEPKISDDNIEVRRVAITPTKAYCLPPGTELSNRVLRKYKNVADRFLRVTFMDEGQQQMNASVLTYHVAPIVKDITSYSFPQRTTVFKRVKSILLDGFYLCGRKFFFLAFSSNQLRDRSAWFFADDKNITVDSIRKWMGKFSNRNVAKCAARMGQCFSSTYHTIDVPQKEVNFELEDIKRNGYDFSDGIGKITPVLAMDVAKKLQLTENPPSAYQCRYAGCKGVVAVWPATNDGIRLSLRPSMIKFESSHTVLEVVSWTRFQPGFLNRQIITLLSALDVPDNVFAILQDSMVCKLDHMLVDADIAYEILTKSCAEQGNTAAMMLSAGFRPQTEPHLRNMLACIRTAQLGDLRKKARIFIQNGRWLMGCLDELGILEQGQCFIQASVPSLENCFSKHGSRFAGVTNNKNVITGTVAIAKNPCLHPGDIRILEAIDVPALHHLVDCLVFPQKGERPHSNEASGSDLDGDLYFVTWDENLIPPSKKSWLPMDYNPGDVKTLPHQVSHRDIIDFFSKNMVNENLGVICNAHVVHADLDEYGALGDKCIQLAELAAIAVDFPKTGKIVAMPHDLKPKVYPDFMEKVEFQSYKSEKILGRLFRKVKDASYEELSSSDLVCRSEDLPYDIDLDIPGSSDYIAEAWKNKCSYDRQLNSLLAQYQVSSEGEIITGHVWSLGKYSSRKQSDAKERLKNAYYALHKEFRQVFEALCSDFDGLTNEERSFLFEQKASAWYQVTYHPRWVAKSVEMKEPEGDAVPVLLSFPWIAADYLVRIKVKSGGSRKTFGQNPIDKLANYIIERI